MEWVWLSIFLNVGSSLKFNNTVLQFPVVAEVAAAPVGEGVAMTAAVDAAGIAHTNWIA